MRLVAVTGVGIVSSLGASPHAVLRGLRAGRRPFTTVRPFDATAFRATIAAQVDDAAVEHPLFHRRHASRTDRLALVAAADALHQAHLPHTDRERAALFVGASTGGMLEMEEARAQGQAPSAATYRNYPGWATARALQRALDIRGPLSTTMTACSSAAHALGLAMQRIRAGEIETAIAGGAEALSRLTLAGFGSLGVLDANGTRPFDEGRQGITLGEGAAFLVLEPLARAQARGARALAILAGYGASADAHHMTQPRDDGGGASAAMKAAVEDAGLTADAVTYVNAHGTGTRQNDAMEARAIRALVADRPVFVSSPKSLLGHTLGAAGALEAAVSVLAIDAGLVPPSAGVETPMPELGPLRLVREATAARVDVVVSSSFAFGGNNAALVFTHPDHASQPTPPPRRKVAITRGAVLSPHGLTTTPEALSALVDAAPTSQHTWTGLEPGDVLGKNSVRRLDALSAHAAALYSLVRREAFGDDVAEVVVTFGTAFGALDATGVFLERLFAKGPGLVNPLEFPNLVHNAPAGHASIALGARGPNVACCQEELAGDDAVAAALTVLSTGRSVAALAGGGDLASTQLDEGYAALGLTTKHASVLGVVALEGDATRAWAGLLGHAVCGRAQGLREAVRLALSRARTDEVSMWLASGTDEMTRAHEATVAVRAPKVPLRTILGDAQGSGPAALAVAAALVHTGRAERVLVTSVTRDGAAAAFVVGAP